MVAAAWQITFAVMGAQASARLSFYFNLWRVPAEDWPDSMHQSRH
jgi:hypothetical protein